MASPQMPTAPPAMSRPFFNQKPYEFGDWCYERRGLFPGFYTLMVAAMFSPVVIIGLDAGMDPSVQYWLGYGTVKMVTWVIILMIACHVFHLVAGRPRFYPTLCSTVVPAILIILAGMFLLQPGHHVGNMLRSPDCTSFDKKLALDNSYRVAAAIFDTCVQRVATSTNSTPEATAPLLDVTDCSEYKAAPSDVLADNADKWAYLQKLENTLGCSGWCTPGEPNIWTRQHYVLDLCAPAAGNVISYKASRAGLRLVVLGFLIFLVSLCAVNTMSNAMRKRDIDW